MVLNRSLVMVLVKVTDDEGVVVVNLAINRFSVQQ